MPSIKFKYGKGENVWVNSRTYVGPAKIVSLRSLSDVKRKWCHLYDAEVPIRLKELVFCPTDPPPFYWRSGHIINIGNEHISHRMDD